MQDASLQKKCTSGDLSDAESDRIRLVNLKDNLIGRARILSAVRCFFSQAGFIEVETPLRIPAPAPELYIDTEPSGDRFLIASPELQMKRLAAAGYDKIFQLCRCFRQGERGEKHLPEFTMLEWYRLEADMSGLMTDCENLLIAAANGAFGIDAALKNRCGLALTTPFERIEVADAFERWAGWRPNGNPDAERFDRDLVDKVEPNLPSNRPVFLVGYPSALASLSRLDPQNPERAERFELYAGGLELANGFSELTCPHQQRRRFESEEAARRAKGKAPYPTDVRFLSALTLGLGDCAGIALGIDRLVMLLLGAGTIDEVTAFPEGTF